MVWSRDGEAERPPLSEILPRFYLGAESDVTQDQLASLGISYVLSVSRCSPQPSFLPRSRYLRIPIDDSLWDDLLPWIPQALQFIDAAMSSGASVLVHCAAGISRSPALAVAYIMYSLEMDLDQAYRFVKERRPSISPNFNFLGQLQHFQDTLSQKSSGGDSFIQKLDNQPSSVGDRVSQYSQNEADRGAEDASHHRDTQQRLTHPESGNKLWTLDMNICQNQQRRQKTHDVAASNPREATKPAAKPTQLHLPSGPAALSEKRKSLTLSLTPLGTRPPPSTNSSRQSGVTTPSEAASIHSWETRDKPEAKTQSHSASCRRPEENHKEQSLLSPFSITLNKLFDWGERLLLGGVFVPPVRMGQPALPYKC